MNVKKKGEDNALFSPGRWIKSAFMAVLFLLLLPVAFGQSISGDLQVCQGSTESYQVSGGGSYDWTVNGGTIISTSVGVSQIDVEWDDSGAASITAVSGATSISETVNVLEVQEPSIAETNGVLCNFLTGRGKVIIREDVKAQDSKLEGQVLLTSAANACIYTCENSTYTYYTPEHSGSTYEWTAIGASSVSSNGNEVSVTWGTEGSGVLTVVETNANGCETTSSSCVQIMPAPSAEFTAIPAPENGVITICRNQSVNFIDQSEGAVNWSWDFGDGYGSSQQNPSHAYDTPGTYTVTLTVSNGLSNPVPIKDENYNQNYYLADVSCNCTSTYTLTVTVLDADAPVIECISAICGNESESYSTPADCDQYSWSVIGGTITSQDGSNVTVDWGDNTSAQGYITLDVGDCPGYCPVPTTEVIPIIPSATVIDGETLVCYGSAHVYSVPQMAGVTYTWLVPGGSVIAGQGSNQIMVAWSPTNYTEGTYTISVSYENELLGCSGTAELDVYLAPSLDILNENRAKICVNGTNGNTSEPITLINAFTEDPVSGNWTVITPNGQVLQDVVTNSSTFTGFTYSYGAGTYTLIASAVSGTYCNGEVITTVIVRPEPAAATAITGADFVCPGSTQTYSAVSAESGTYNWSVTGGTITSQSGPSVTVQWDNSGIYSLSVSITSVYGCTSPVYTREVSPYSPVQAPTISGVNEICFGGESTYTYAGSAIPGVSYEWSVSPESLGNIISPVNANNAQISWADGSGTATATVILTTTDQCGNTDQSTWNVELSGYEIDFALPVICQDNEFSVSASGTITQEWSFGDGTTSTDATANHTYSDIGTYPITLYAVNTAGCEASVTKLVTVNAAPIALITSPDDLEYCPDEEISVQLEAVNPSGGTFSYDWYVNGGTTPFSTTNPTTVTTAGTYYAVFTNEQGCQSTSNEIVVRIVSCGGGGCPMEAHTADFNHTIDPTNCNTVSFTPNNSSNIYPVSWSYNKDGQGFVLMSNAISPTYTFNEAGYYTIRMVYRGPNVNGVPGDSVNCYIDKQIFLPIAADFSYGFACLGNEYLTDLTDESVFFSPESIATHNWIVDGTSEATTQDHSTSLTPGSHTVTLEITSSLTGNTCLATKEVLVPTLPEASFTHTAAACPGSLVDFASTSTGDSLAQWNWTFGTGIPVSSSENPSRQFNAPGTYDVTLTVTNLYNCSDVATATIVIDNPENGTITANGPLEFCEGGSVVLTAPAGSNYLWSTGETTQSITVSESGAYDVTLQGSNGCEYTAAPVTVTVQQAGSVALDGDVELCSGTRTIVTATAGFSSYTWSYDVQPYDGTPNLTYTTSSAIFNRLLGAGTYQISVIAHNANGCSTPEEVIEVTVIESPAEPIISSNDPLCEGESNVLTISNPVIGAEYYWSTGQTGTSITVTQAGTYNVTLDVGNGCPVQARRPALVNSAPDVSFFMSGCYEFCKDEAPIILNGSSEGINYWYQENGTFDTYLGVGNTYAVSDPGSYYVIVKGNTGCTAETGQFQVDFLPLPDVQVHVDQDQYCEGSEAVLTAEGADSYEWYQENDEYSCTGNELLTNLTGLTDALAQDNVLHSVYVSPTVGEIDLVNNSNYNPFLPVFEPYISVDADIVWSISPGSSVAYWYIYSQSNYDSYVEMELDKSTVGGGLFDFSTIATVVSVTPDPNYLNPDGTTSHFIVEAQLDDNSIVQIPGKMYQVLGSGGFYVGSEEMIVGSCTNSTFLGTGESITLQLEGNTTYYVVGTNDETGCSATVEVPLNVSTDHATATIDCCEDEAICAGDQTSIEVHFTGTGPWTFTYTDGMTQNTVTTTSNPYIIQATPSMTTTYTLLSLTTEDGACTEVCGKATVGVTQCTPVVSTGKGKKVKDCSENCFNTTVTDVVESGENCLTVTMTVSCNNSCQSALSHYSVSVPCGTITAMSNSLGYQMSGVNPDPTSGISGFKVDNIQDFCEDNQTSELVVSYTVCTTESDCGGGFCPPLVAYKAGNCVNYEIASVPNSAMKIEDGDDQQSLHTDVQLNVFPNPFSTSTRLALDVPEQTEVLMEVYDLNGRKLVKLYQGTVSSGTTVFEWDGISDQGEQLPNGVYYVKCKVGDKYQYLKLMRNR